MIDINDIYHPGASVNATGLRDSVTDIMAWCLPRPSGIEENRNARISDEAFQSL
jgi:hypothetical protein